MGCQVQIKVIEMTDKKLCDWCLQERDYFCGLLACPFLGSGPKTKVRVTRLQPPEADRDELAQMDEAFEVKQRRLDQMRQYGKNYSKAEDAAVYSKQVKDLIKDDPEISARLGKYNNEKPAIDLLLAHEFENYRFRFSQGIDSVSGVEVIVFRDPFYSDSGDRVFRIILIEHDIHNIDNLEIIANRIKSLILRVEFSVVPSDLRSN